MPDYKNNPFMEMTLQNENNKTKSAPAKPVVAKPKESKKPKDGIERDTSVLYRLNKGFYREIQMFAKLQNVSVNTLIEQAVLDFMTNKENQPTFIKAKEMASKIPN